MAVNQMTAQNPGTTHGRDQAADTPLMMLTYRSRATSPLSETQLGDLQHTAAARNRAEGITGMMVYNDDRIFQWLEGPPASIARIWSSISRDPRHADIEALSMQTAPSRLFSRWSLKLTTGPADPLIGEMTAATMSSTNAAAERLAALAIAAEPTEARLLLHAAYAEFRSIAALTELLIEPAARALGDLWAEDDCGEYEVTLGLCRLQTFLREVATDSMQQQIAHPLVVLVAPLPGEIHMLGATLDAEALWQAGHDTRVRFPSTERALERIVATKWFDAIDLSLSPAFSREHRIERMRHIVDSVRRASKNPALVVITGGRAFYDRTASSDDVHAHTSSTSAAHLPATVARVLKKHA
ncbi:BLUF domain-containing protein [Gemmatimonas sp.]|uniref:BLUF domain-containing protein n=1 Tax=Gemmatimonas sp. TaxID=1962908 RepID=UPI0035624929